MLDGFTAQTVARQVRVGIAFRYWFHGQSLLPAKLATHVVAARSFARRDVGQRRDAAAVGDRRADSRAVEREADRRPGDPRPVPTT